MSSTLPSIRPQEQTIFAQTHLLCLGDQQTDLLCQHDQLWLFWVKIHFSLEHKDNEML